MKVFNTFMAYLRVKIYPFYEHPKYGSLNMKIVNDF